MNKLEELLDIARAERPSPLDTFLAVWRYICQSPEEERFEYFRLFLTDVGLDDIFGSGPQADYSSVIGSITPDIRLLVTRVIENLLIQKLKEEDFYKKLYEKICDASLLPDEMAQTAYLAGIKLDPRIPYYYLDDGCTMSDEEYISIQKEILPYLSRAYYVLSYPFRQKTQVASHLMDIAEEISNKDEKTVYWANIIAILRKMQLASSQAKEPPAPEGKEYKG